MEYESHGGYSGSGYSAKTPRTSVTSAIDPGTGLPMGSVAETSFPNARFVFSAQVTVEYGLVPK